MNGFDIKKIIISFVPVFIVAAVLPFFLLLVFDPPKTSLFTQADQKPELRIWFEPSAVGGSVSTDIKVKVMASFESDNKIAPSMSIDKIASSSLLSINPDSLKYTKPFQGTVTLGTLILRSLQEGEYALTVANESIKIPLPADEYTVKVTNGKVTIVE